MTQGQRDYNVEKRDSEERKYAYQFDYDVMHPFMIESFHPFFQPGSALELGCFEGRFTQRISTLFESTTCVEASGEALAVAKSTLGEKVQFKQGTFEDIELPHRYQNIFLTHVMEHLSDPTLVLRRINREWLDDNGRVFIACPNADAPSRQIAVKMGIIDHNTAVTEGEKAHGHQITYRFDTLERDARSAGLRILHRGGIFFKALANFQWDRLLATDIISKEYLQACFEFGQQHPELCSSIYLVCGKGK